MPWANNLRDYLASCCFYSSPHIDNSAWVLSVPHGQHFIYWDLLCSVSQTIFVLEHSPLHTVANLHSSLNIARWQSQGLTAPNALPRDGTAGGDGWLDHHVLGENSPKRVLGPRTKIAPRLGRDVESLQFDRHQQPREGRSPDGGWSMVNYSVNSLLMLTHTYFWLCIHTFRTWAWWKTTLLTLF